ncbi:MAG: hypothetical protein QOG65_3650 [Actinomycetota bacterium]|jgi:hypothetical protein|nr:hypothetical protein [Actinomycetota bacterium]
MLRSMQTIPRNELIDEQEEELVHTAFEACVAFFGAGAGSPVCASCGWLDTEHAPAVAVVRSLPHRVGNRSLRTPRRLAS